MGVEAYDQVQASTIELEKGDRLLFYTDGVTERFDAQNRLYGEERLCRQMEHPEVDDPGIILNHIVEDLKAFSDDRPSEDDIAMLLAIVD